MLERSLSRPVARASYLYLDDGTAWSACPQRRELEEAVAAVTAAYNEIVGERDYPTNVGRHCAFCDYQSICPSREEIVGRRLSGERCRPVRWGCGVFPENDTAVHEYYNA
jgi:hypothetical protein